MIPLAEARAHVVERCPPRAPVPVPLSQALGCVLAAAVVAREPVPPFAGSAMDGFALRAADVAEASTGSPVPLSVTGELAAGDAPDIDVGGGQAVRIMTGAPLPAGADAIVMVELTEMRGDEVLVRAPVPLGNHIRPAGDDITVGDEVIPAGTVLRPAHLGVLASVGVRRPVVIRRPRVGVISTGDELIDDDRPLAPGQIRESNRPMLLGLVELAGFEPVDLGTVADDEAALEAAMRGATERCDALLTSGGVSMGDYDLVKVVLGKLADMRWMQIAMRPAKPFAFGVLDGIPVFGLPGNPVSSLVSFALLARPGLRRLAGHAALDLPTVTARAGVDLLRSPDGKIHFQRVLCRWGSTGFVAESVGAQGSHQLAATAHANGLAVIPDGDGVTAGGEVTVVLLEDPLAA